jgi:hypothetical protein
MLKIKIPEKEFFDERTQEFYSVKARTLQLEHSLVSISKWESITRKPFLSDVDKLSNKDILLYIKCMTIGQTPSDIAYAALGANELKKITDYISTEQTASWISDNLKKKPGKKEVVTSELIYYWMIAYNIPFECEKWHLSRLLMLIRICQVKNGKPKKMSKSEAMKQQRKLNAERRSKMHSKG